MLTNAASLAKILTGDFVSGIQAIARSYDCMKRMYHQYGKKQSWYDTANVVIGLSNEPLLRIRNLLFTPLEERKNAPKDTNFIEVKKSRNVTFYVIEMLCQVINDKYKMLSERLGAIHFLFLVGINSYDIAPKGGVYTTNVAHFNHT